MSDIRLKIFHYTYPEDVQFVNKFLEEIPNSALNEIHITNKTIVIEYTRYEEDGI